MYDLFMGLTILQHVKIPSKVLHKIYIESYMNFMQDFWS